MRFGNRKLLVAILVICATFIYSCQLRAPLLGTLSDTHHQWLTGSSIKFTDYWMEDGFWADDGLTMDYPRTIEKQAIQDRGPYFSYPSGSTIEIYLLRQLVPHIPAITVIRYFDLFNQLAVALTLAAIVILSCRSHLMAISAALIYIFHPIPMYWHSMVYFADQAIILPFSLVLLLELLIRQSLPCHRRNKLLAAQSLLLTMAAFTDWLAVMLITSIGIFRLISPINERISFRYLVKTALQLGAGPAIALSVWAWQVYLMDGYEFLKWNFSYRANTGLPNPIERFSQLFVKRFVFDYFRDDEIYLFYLSFIFCIYQFIVNRKNPVICVSLISMLTCMLMAFVFYQHTWEHDFTALKFMVPLALISYGIMPAYLADGAEKFFPRFKDASLCVFIALAVYSYRVNNEHFVKWNVQYPNPHVFHQDLALWIGKNSTFDNVFIGKNFTIAHIPPQKISMSHHAVYSFDKLAELDTFIKSTPHDAKFLGIISKNDARNCPINTADIIAHVQSERIEWLIVKLDMDSDAALKRCFTAEVK